MSKEAKESKDTGGWMEEKRLAKSLLLKKWQLWLDMHGYALGKLLDSFA